MRTVLRIIVPAAALAGGLLLNSTPSLAKPEYARRTKKECVFCHPPDSWNLNEAGKYYRDHNYSLKGYQPKRSSATVKLEG
jgi:hypothetical protein